MGFSEHNSMQILETFEYEPIFMDFFTLDEIEARILLMLISQGGFTTKNYLESNLSIERPTLNKKLQNLVEKRIIRQNLEFKLKRITLLINHGELLRKLSKIRDQTKFAFKFIIESQNIQSKSIIRSRFKNAMLILLPPSRNNYLLAEVLTLLYIDQISSNKTITLKELNLALKSADHHLSENYLILILSGMSSLIRIFSSKIMRQVSTKSKIIRPLFSLETMARFLLNERMFYLSYCEQTFNRLFNNVEDLTSDRSPHQLLPFPSDMKKRINSCLPFSNTIFLLYNGTGEIEEREFLKLILNAQKFRINLKPKGHKIFLLTDNKKDLPDGLYPDLEIKKIPQNTNKDYRKRELILFSRELNEPFGAIIFPLKPLTPYYTITQNAIEEINDYFLRSWDI
ncbi:MAG: hypothetical protein KAT16_00070 [Candidatus Heimdallarchaeota archaeon]|nr:hypothetical protein [Candidatus Heimdallarchaeota archaeon]